MRRFLTLASLACIVLGTPGCTTALKRGFKEFKGASSKAKAVPGLDSAKLLQCRSVKVGNPRSDLGALVDTKYSGALPEAIRKKLTQGEDPLLPGGTPTLDIDPEITWYNEAGGLGGIMGSDSHAVVLFWLSTEGTALGKIQVVTKSAASHTSEADMATATAKGLARFFKKQRQKDGD